MTGIIATTISSVELRTQKSRNKQVKVEKQQQTELIKRF